MEEKKNKYAYDKEYYERGRRYFSEGSTARQMQEASQTALPKTPHRHDQNNGLPEPRRRPEVRPEKKTKVRVKRVSRVDMPMLFLTILAMIATLAVCISYLQAQSNLVQMNKSIYKINTEISSLRDQNNAKKSSIVQAVDLEYIYAIAVKEFGMVYPNKNQVITYEENEVGYVRQYELVPKARVESYFAEIFQ